MKSHEKKKKKSSSTEDLKFTGYTLDYEILQEDEEDVLYEVQEYVKEITPEYLRKENLLY
jgi:hypothetical protein